MYGRLSVFMLFEHSRMCTARTNWKNLTNPGVTIEDIIVRFSFYFVANLNAAAAAAAAVAAATAV